MVLSLYVDVATAPANSPLPARSLSLSLSPSRFPSPLGHRNYVDINFHI